MPRIATSAFALALTALSLSAGLSSAIAKPAVEVAFVLDTTGSMGGLLEGAKRKIWSIATAIVDSNPDADIRMGLVAYRDIGDDYVTRKVELTTDIQDLYANLLELKARGGGDWPESVNEALDVAVNKLQWTSGGDTRRIVFLVGDAPPHMDYAQDTKYPRTLSVARQRDIIVNAVLAGDAQDTARIWRDIAQNGNGRFIPIPQDGGEVVLIETPFDEEIIILQREINGTVIPYGPKHLQKRTEGKTKQLSEVAAAAPAQASEMASYLNKRSKATSEAVTGDGDLVADVTAGRKQLLRHQGGRAARQSARAEARTAHGRGQQADGPAQGAQRKTVGTGGEARQIRRRPARQGGAESVVVRPRRRGYAEGADQAVSC